ncbi:hypothetical protein DY000_02020024 [Brassica cretica]|uniref:Uncharacterized protein n=1 Tax=Brassica cretica TaxID=69181 RepID=A0ABQ7E3V6_BRACR|nr:hypothetical protein DY000_02020024 [Brassica cretica]
MFVRGRESEKDEGRGYLPGPARERPHVVAARRRSSHRKRERPHVVALITSLQSQKTRATSRGRCETSLRERFSSPGDPKRERPHVVALITSLPSHRKREQPHVVAARRRSESDS